MVCGFLRRIHLEILRAMKRISRNPQKFDLMRLIDAYARAQGVDIRDQTQHDALLGQLGKQLEENRNNDILIHGLRIQAMFAYVVAALGQCRLIREEDAGDMYAFEPTIRAPDFRVVTVSNAQFLVEVKNCHSVEPPYEYGFSRQYLDAMKSYAAVVQSDLYIALYWSRLKMWSLLSTKSFQLRDDQYVISLTDAIAGNDMRVLGDCMIATIPSLSLKLLADPEKPRTIDATGQAAFTIKQAQLYCGDKLITDPVEQQLAWFFMQYGNWAESDLAAEVQNGELIST